MTTGKIEADRQVDCGDNRLNEEPGLGGLA